MSDVLVTCPYQPFTLQGQFKAVFNGYVYCGAVDAVDPSVSQVQAYLVNEDGSKVPVAQPLRTNAGGFLVYNGQPAKFVTDSNHSLLVRDSLGQQVWYAPNIALIDPQSFVGLLSGPQGAGMIGYGSSNVAKELDNITSSISSISASSLGLTPGAGNGAGNAALLNTLSSLDVDGLVVDDYYEFTSDAVITRPNGRFKLSGSGELKGINAYLTVTGTITSYGQITAVAAKGGSTVTVADATGINPGDTICIHNQNAFSFSAHRSEYTAGEYNIVLSKSGNQLTLANRLMFDYTALTNIKLFKMNLIDFSHDAVTVSTTGTSVYAMRVKFAAANVTGRPDILALDTTACSAAVVYEKCPSVSYDLGDVINDTVGTATQYGISFSSCWNAVGYVQHAHAYRHGVTTGGDAADCSIPCKSVLVLDGSSISNVQASGIYAADFHGNTIDSYYRGCNIYGDIGLAGENVGCPDCTVYGQRANYAVDFHEVVGGWVDLSGMKFKPLPTFNFDAIVGFSSSTLSAKVDRPFSVLAENVSFEITSAVQRLFNLVYNQASAVSGKSTVKIDGVSVSGTATGLTELARLVQLSPGIRPDRVSIKNAPRLSDAQKYVVLSGTFQGCLMTLPASTSQQISLTVTGGGWFSTTGGAGGYALHTFPHYPVAPQVSGSVVNIVRAESPKLDVRFESVGTNNATAYISTGSSAVTVAGGATKFVSITAQFENVFLP